MVEYDEEIVVNIWHWVSSIQLFLYRLMDMTLMIMQNDCGRLK